MLDYKTMQDKLQSSLSMKRYIHTMGVVEEAIKLSNIYGVDQDKAKIAALLHDCAKDYPDDMKRRLCKEFHVEIDDIMKSQIDLVHSFLGAKVAKREYNVSDYEILEAIRYHTTGKASMSMLEKIVFIADYIEPNRKEFDGLKEIRILAYTNIDLAVKKALEYTIAYTEQRGRILHPLTLEALEDYKKLEEKI
jgi:nicotinate-nucleotide adenylyltransferase